MNNLARLEHMKADEAGVSGTTALDAVLERTCEQVSRDFEAETRRSFVARYGIRYLERHPRECPETLTIFEDLASITTLLVDDDANGTYELTLVENTDFWVERENDLDTNTPITLLRLNPDATTVQIYSWPTRKRAIKLTGLWGYSYELEDTTIDTAEALDTTETDVTVSATAASLIFPGDTIVIDSEQMAVTAVASVTLTVVRAINGTTAAAHDTAASVYVRRYPRDVERAVSERVVGLRWDVQSGYAGMASLTGDPSVSAGRTTDRASFARWRQAVKRYKDWRVA